MLDRIGLKTPDYLQESDPSDIIANDTTGMIYELHDIEGETYVGAYHDAVGLVTWYWSTDPANDYDDMTKEED